MRNMILFDDKGKTYEIFKAYYHRDLLEVFGKESQEAFEAFVRKHPRFIVKPFDGACGIGIKIVDSQGKNVQEILPSMGHVELASRSSTPRERMCRKFCRGCSRSMRMDS